MAGRIEAIIGREYMVQAAKPQVIAFLAPLPLSRQERRALYIRWCREVGLEAYSEDVDRVMGRRPLEDAPTA